MFQHYEVLNLLGKGGFASVYKAKCLRTNHLVAIKMIDIKIMKSNGMTDRVIQEVQIHSRLKHPSILELYTFFEDADFVYLVLELAHNGELQRFLRENNKIMSEPEASIVLRQVVSGLIYLHSHQILHRDMSLSNLLLTKDMQVRIADFGLATQLTRPDEKHMTMCGTPNYISPEVASRSSHGLPADVWGLGCMLYTLLVGKPPFDCPGGVKSTLTRVVMSDYMIPLTLSMEAKDLIDRLLRKNPLERLSLDQVLSHPFMNKNEITSQIRQSNTLTDSGILTISSQATSHNNSNRQYLPIINKTPGGIFRSKSEECFSYKTPIHGTPSFGFDEDQENYLKTSNSILSLNKNSFLRNSPIQQQERVSVPPINSMRLLPTRHRTKNAILSISSSGEVIMEFIKFKAKYREDRIVDVCKISKDGQRIVLFQPEVGRIMDDGTHSQSDGADCCFTYENLPTKHWKKYIYAARFVELVRAKTPKVTYYSNQAKCVLMETLEDFEVCFYSGLKINKSSTDGIKILNENGLEISENSSKPEFDHFEESYHHCLTLEKTLSNLQTDGVCFPVIIGRRPTITPTGRCGLLENNSNSSTPRTPLQIPSFQLSLNSVQSYKPSKNPSKKIHVPGIGFATLLSSGVVQIEYSDGSVLSVIPPEQGDGVTYKQNGLSTHFKPSDHLPQLIRSKLQEMPTVLKHLRNPISSATSTSTPIRFLR